MKKKLLGGLALALLLAGCGNSGDSDKEKTDDGKKTYKIGIIQQMEHPALDSAREGLEKYLKGKSDAKFEITVKNAQGDNGTADTIAKQFVSDDVDLIYSIATRSSALSAKPPTACRKCDRWNRYSGCIQCSNGWCGSKAGDQQ